MAEARQGGEHLRDGGKFVLQDPRYGFELLSRLNELRGAALFTDSILCIGQEEFPCHSVVLAASSPYFEAMFKSNLREKRDMKVSFDEVSPWTLTRLIDYTYTGRLEITPENAQEMLAAGNHFQYPAIVNACCEFLCDQLHPSNCFGIETFAQIHSCHQLQEDAHKFVLENFSSVAQHDEFLELPIERLLAYVSSDHIDVRNEETVYEAMMRWIMFDTEERKKHLYDLLREVRLPVIDIQYLRSMQSNALIKKCEDCISLIQDAQIKHETIHDQYGRRRRSMQDAQFHPRPSTVAKEMMVVVGGVNNYVTKSVEMFDPQKDKWIPLPEMPQPVSWYSASSLVDSLFITGGIIDGRIISQSWKFDPVRRVWSEISSMTSPRAKHASVVLDDRLYVLGGVTCTLSFEIIDNNLIECYDPSKRSWSVVGHSQFPRKQSQVVPFNNMLVEVGGLQGDVKVNTMVCYLCSSPGIEIKPLREHFILPEAIQYAQIIVLHGVFYIIWEDTKKVISLNPDKRTFQRLSDMNYSHQHSSATILGEKIYITGGLIDSRPSKIVECYDLETDTWTVEKPLLESRGFHGCVTVNM